jgi:predicted dehydrogenase
LKPQISGPSLVLGDIGTHAHHLASFVTGLAMESVSADVGTIVSGRIVHDIAQVRFRLKGGARGRIDVCNAAAGMSNQLIIRVFGETGHAEWNHRENGRLALASLEGDVRIMGSGQPNLSPLALASTHLPRLGHPEGLQEAVANLYVGFADLMLERRGRPAPPVARLTPTIDDGVAGLAFVQACLDSSARQGALTPLPGLEA